MQDTMEHRKTRTTRAISGVQYALSLLRTMRCEALQCRKQRDAHNQIFAIMHEVNTKDQQTSAMRALSPTSENLCSERKHEYTPLKHRLIY